MTYYALALIALQLLAVGSDIGKEDGPEALKAILSILIMLPLYGRIFGWW